MKITTNIKGQIAATKVELRAMELGYVPSKPIFDTRYDLILDNRIGLLKVQIKYADGVPTHSQGSVVVKLAYEDRKKRIFTYKEEEIDGLIVYIPKIDKLCFLPPRVFVGKKKLYIRLQRSKNNQNKGIILAKDYYW